MNLPPADVTASVIFRHILSLSVTSVTCRHPSLPDPSSAVSGSKTVRICVLSAPDDRCRIPATVQRRPTLLLHGFCTVSAPAPSPPPPAAVMLGGGGGCDWGGGGRQPVTGVGVVTRRWSHRNWRHPVRLSPPTTTRSAFSLHAGSRT